MRGGRRRESGMFGFRENICERCFGILFLGSVVRIFSKFFYVFWKFVLERDTSF